MTFKRGKCTRTGSGFSHHGVYSNQKPGWADLTYANGPDKDYIFKGIYRIKGNTLTLAYFSGKKKIRPQTFDSQDDLIIRVFKRAKN